jgi:hypothetical protein
MIVLKCHKNVKRMQDSFEYDATTFSTMALKRMTVSIAITWNHDSQYNVTQDNDTQHNYAQHRT